MRHRPAILEQERLWMDFPSERYEGRGVGVVGGEPASGSGEPVAQRAVRIAPLDVVTAIAVKVAGPGDLPLAVATPLQNPR